ncbi:MAG: ribonuclease D [Chromatiales bacterium]|jgi:ribonuclease D|nr:ribonuclease D [Chromatiales bacterium]MDP6150875.1 HRDC domain-containing protein [Gammaproteobacteria bacterium]MDP7093241.1 HRDC domain-containing protein [Gammaproteobacteria bacterium]MDP7270556.1 HRDC domain-containing protein [Gammaproteobacteria bacterium]HJP04830.1 HRDC domain-containing protein [Gammaproteobacteria bacterium]
MPAPAQLPLLIDEQPDLDKVCSIVSDTAELFVDTEFVRTKTYAPRLGLLQLKAGELTACIDPLADLDLQKLWSLLFDVKRMCVLHAAKQDMEVLWFEQRQVISNLLDTQTCAALLGHQAQIGYAGLVKELLGKELGKTQTRTDWSRRPLTRDQLSYAEEDVAYLPEIKKILIGQLEELGRLDWAMEDSRLLGDSSLYRPDPENAWQRIRSIPYLLPDEQARARVLAEWREDRAVKTDRPRQWILSDKALLQLAAANPASENALGHIEDLPPPVARKQGSRLIAIMGAANKAIEKGELELVQQTAERGTENTLSKKLMKLVRARAEELGIAAEVLASKRDISALIRNESSLRVMSGWRQAVIGNELQAVL